VSFLLSVLQKGKQKEKTDWKKQPATLCYLIFSICALLLIDCVTPSNSPQTISKCLQMYSDVDDTCETTWTQEAKPRHTEQQKRKATL
jgi:uncharacterized membrane protein